MDFSASGGKRGGKELGMYVHEAFICYLQLLRIRPARRALNGLNVTTAAVLFELIDPV